MPDGETPPQFTGTSGNEIGFPGLSDNATVAQVGPGVMEVSNENETSILYNSEFYGEPSGEH